MKYIIYHFCWRPPRLWNLTYQSASQAPSFDIHIEGVVKRYLIHDYARPRTDCHKTQLPSKKNTHTLARTHARTHIHVKHSVVCTLGIKNIAAMPKASAQYIFLSVRHAYSTIVPSAFHTSNVLRNNKIFTRTIICCFITYVFHVSHSKPTNFYAYGV